MKQVMCVDCGSTDYRTIEWHHRVPRNGGKTVGQVMLGKYDKLVAELEKCDPLCANCHKIRHFVATGTKNRGKWG